MKNNFGTALFNTVISLFVLSLLGLFYYYGFYKIDPSCNGIDKSSLYCALHYPGTSIINYIGVGLVTICILFISGIWKLFTGSFTTKKVGTIELIAFGVALLGAALCFA